MSQAWDAFISYRRLDGTGAAHWLRRRIERHRLPAELAQGRPVQLRAYLDTVFRRSTSDFFAKVIVPAIRSAKAFILVVTPGAHAQHRDGSPNWVERELEEFLREHPDGEGLIVVLAGGRLEDPLPARLSTRFPNIDI